MSWKRIVKTVAPALGAALGGPMGGAAAKFLSGQLLGKEDAEESELEAFIAGANPEQLAEIKRIDAEFKAKMKELDIDVYRIEVDDRKDARGLAKTNMIPQIALSTLFVVGYFGLLYMIFKGHIALDDSIRDMANILIGVLTANIPTIMAFWFGSSSSSKVKTDMLKANNG